MLPNLHIFGIQGSGKDTQATRLAQHFNLALISSGDLIRKRIADGDATAEHLEELLSEGKLVPNEIIYALLEEALDGDLEQGVVCAGIIRTESQRTALVRHWAKHNLDQPFALELRVSEEVALERCLKRSRSDDTPDALAERFRTYHEQTEPLLEYFRETNRFLQIDGELEPTVVTEQLYEMLPTYYPLLHGAN